MLFKSAKEITKQKSIKLNNIIIKNWLIKTKKYI